MRACWSLLLKLRNALTALTTSEAPAEIELDAIIVYMHYSIAAASAVTIQAGIITYSMIIAYVINRMGVVPFVHARAVTSSALHFRVVRAHRARDRHDFEDIA